MANALPDPKLLDTQIDLERNNLRTDKLDLTYGELASMYQDGELIIAPEYQRLFRWAPFQKAKFIESILLGFPIPAIFVAENESGVWELVDGLQRVSTILEFMGLLAHPDDKSLILPASRLEMPEGTTRLPALDGFTFDELSFRSRMSVKRASCRVEVIKVGSASNMKYEVFERLNTGSVRLTDQEIRNCIFRSANPEFMRWVDELAKFDPFSSSLGLSELQVSSMYDRGLVLRFFTLKNNLANFRHEVEPFITAYTRDVVEKTLPFDMGSEEQVFKAVFKLITDALGDDAWRHYRGERHRGAFSVYVFDALSVGVARNLEKLSLTPLNEVRRLMLRLKESPMFIENIGGGANTRVKMQTRLNAAISVLGTD